ncbi:ABC transporter ATP-binding protein [Acidocella aromatica]|uniref:Iron(III) transport system ATP-binding protein n=1 Tax=Acidocella aromatica TaxID=1303579 RepID=A0A840VC87_9PROT|nr:ABC transporter ATP-binding protein [Acidocella aromatica]MBB5373413.1 iron(III) transport system ATP-binding protein [Acidocella aromatica]
MRRSLRILGASRRLGGRVVLRGIDLALNDGDFLVLAGESGSGKTTMLRMIAGLDRADAGIVEINGTVMDDAGRVFIPAERRGLGMVFQDFALWPHLSCLENVALALPPVTPKRNEAAMALLDRLGVAAVARRRPAQLSGGQQQRVGIARALATRPSLLLLDEPLSSLDLETRERLREELRESLRATGVSAVLVSHDPEDCWKLADQVAVLENGAIRQQGTPQALWEAPASPYIARFTGAHGGIPVPVMARCGQAALVLGGEVIVLPGAPPEKARLFWRDDAICPAGEGGIAAEVVSVNFEAGRFRVRWRVPGLAQPLSGYAAAPVPLGAQRISIDPAKIFLFDVSGDHCP